MSADGGEMKRVREEGRLPRFAKDGERMYFVEDVTEQKQAFKSARLDGGDERTVFTSKYATQFVPSPDEQWLAFTELFQAYIVPFPKTGREIDLHAKTKAVPIKRVTRDAGTSLHAQVHDGPH